MSTRTNFPPQKVITSGDMSATTITSSATILRSMSGCSYTFSWSGTSPVGTLSVEVSNDYSLNPDGSVNNAGTWNPLTLNVSGTFVASIPVSGNTGKGAINVSEIEFWAIRTVYTKASGTGTLTAWFMGKVQ